MTLDGKLACLQTSTAVPRLRIPAMGGAEGLHQLVRKGGFGPEKPIPNVANSNETTRTRSSSDFDAQLLREYYSVPFRVAITGGGARWFLASYDKWRACPSCCTRRRDGCSPANGPRRHLLDRSRGARAGGEVAQLCAGYVASKVPRPIRALKGFQRVSLEPGESRTIQLP